MSDCVKKYRPIVKVGYPLFHRSKKGTLPTEMGKHLMPYILQMIEAEAQLKNEVKAMQSDVSGTIKNCDNSYALS